MTRKRDVVTQLVEVARRVGSHARVDAEWGSAARAKRGGVSCLFAGPRGIGKIMAAEILVAHLHRRLHRIDLTTVVSKYIGETAKNLDRVFDDATSANAVLYFDEADGLFGQRTDLRDTHDRYANLELSYRSHRTASGTGDLGRATASPDLRRRLELALATEPRPRPRSTPR